MQSYTDESLVQPTEERLIARAKERKIKPKDRFPVHPLVDWGLTSIFLASVMWTIHTLYSTHFSSLIIFLVGIPCVWFAIWSTKKLFTKLGRYLSDGSLRAAPFNRPLHNRVKMRKFRDQSYQLVIHLFSVLGELYIMSGETWWDDTRTCWIPAPKEQELAPFMRYFYMIQLSIWCYMGLAHKFFESKHADYVTMFVHHIVTLLLVSGSHSARYERIGVLVMYVHDISDIPIDLLKMTNYLRLTDRAGFFATEISYMLSICGWLYYRLSLFPLKVIHSPMIESLSIVVPKGDPAYDNLWYAMWHGVEQFPLWHMMCGLLSTLCCMHCIWFYMLARVGIKLVMQGPRTASKDEYEGDSEDSDGD